MHERVFYMGSEYTYLVTQWAAVRIHNFFMIAPPQWCWPNMWPPNRIDTWRYITKTLTTSFCKVNAEKYPFQYFIFITIQIVFQNWWNIWLKYFDSVFSDFLVILGGFVLCSIPLRFNLFMCICYFLRITKYKLWDQICEHDLHSHI